MNKKLVWDWEDLDQDTDRTRVIGGWIVRSYLSGESEALVFVEDKYHEWGVIYPPPETCEEEKESISDGY